MADNALRQQSGSTQVPDVHRDVCRSYEDYREPKIAFRTLQPNTDTRTMIAVCCSWVSLRQQRSSSHSRRTISLDQCSVCCSVLQLASASTSSLGTRIGGRHIELVYRRRMSHSLEPANDSDSRTVAVSDSLRA